MASLVCLRKRQQSHRRAVRLSSSCDAARTIQRRGTLRLSPSSPRSRSCLSGPTSSPTFGASARDRLRAASRTALARLRGRRTAAALPAGYFVAASASRWRSGVASLVSGRLYAALGSVTVDVAASLHRAGRAFDGLDPRAVSHRDASALRPAPRSRRSRSIPAGPRFASVSDVASFDLDRGHALPAFFLPATAALGPDRAAIPLAGGDKHIRLGPSSGSAAPPSRAASSCARAGNARLTVLAGLGISAPCLGSFSADVDSAGGGALVWVPIALLCRRSFSKSTGTLFARSRHDRHNVCGRSRRPRHSPARYLG